MNKCPLGEVYCPHRKTENLAHIVIAILMVNQILLGGILLWRSDLNRQLAEDADSSARTAVKLWCTHVAKENPQINFLCDDDK